MFMWLKQKMPRGLYGRAALILLLPVLSLQFSVGLVFIQRHFNQVTEQMTRAALVDLTLVVGGQGARPDLAGALGIDIAQGAGPERDQRVFYDLSGRVVTRVLKAGLPGVSGVDLSDPRRVSFGLERELPLQVSFDRSRVSASNPHQLLVIMVVISAFMTLIAYIFLRNQLRPIRRLGRAAQEYGRGRIVPYRLAGATEVRAAGVAFLEMRARLERQSQARRMMLSGVSHDLRTPLTRMRLELSLMDEDEAAPMLRDVQDMEQLLDAFLAYARDSGEEGASSVLETDPAALLREAVHDAARSGNVALGTVATPGPIPMRMVSVRRALDNLLANAHRYGAGEVRASLIASDAALRFRIEDNGPGIPEDRREDALRPFVRLDPARNQDRGSGVGLGLAIVEDIARTHGGQLILGESDLGGLRADLVLPR
ncbi:MAG: two-component sensor histidine kinase [Rhodobacterales bacterium]|nr:MAG: two-component sensor histidine kinase [Rhodobacterales bacterium]